MTRLFQNLPLNGIVITKTKSTTKPGKDRHQESMNKAIAMIDKTLKIDPQNSDAWYQKGLCYQKLGSDEEANQCFQKAKEFTIQTTFDFYNLFPQSK
jgi:Flp pilus assembly protein TadD